MDQIDLGELYLMYLNGGAPVCEWTEIQEWARGVLRIDGTTGREVNDGSSVAGD